MKRRKKSGGGANWMDTYGDMVTLLLCFFVLLYSISTIDQVKWENLVRSMNPNVENVSQVVQDTDIEPGEETVPGSIQSDEAFDQLYEALSDEMEKADVADQVTIHKGKDYQFITFRDTSPLYDGTRGTGAIGFPLVELEDGTRTRDIPAVLKSLGIEAEWYFK